MCDICRLQTLIFVNKYSSKQLPGNFANYFCETQSIHSYGTRNSTGYFVPFAKTGIRIKTIRHSGTRLWNQLPTRIIESKSLPIFKSQLKYLILNEYLN